MNARPIAITSGEPAGIGPDLCIMAAQRSWPFPLVLLGDPALLTQRAALRNLPLKLHPLNGASGIRPGPLPKGECYVVPFSLAKPCTPGQLNKANVPYVIDMLKHGAQAATLGQFAAIVTAPVQKSIINEAGIAFSGHTEFFAEFTQTKRVVMMLAARQLRVALATTHLPLAEVANHITRELLREIIIILNDELITKFGIAEPRILVCGLNPHAGEAGHLGQEELHTIEPVLQELRAQAIQLTGPLPADTLFTPKYLDHADAVLAMYHDQGLPVLKYAGFGQAANITLGLPIIRTSVDHGTALDLAGTDAIDPGSLFVALECAQQLASAAHA